MLIVEQNVGFAVQVADRYSVLKRGEIVAMGPTSDPSAEQVINSQLQV